MNEQDYESAVANALTLALEAELDCDDAIATSTAHIPSDYRPTAADTWTIGEKEFSIEIGGHELLASIPSTRSSVSSDPNDVDESEYHRDDDASLSEQEAEDDDEDYYDDEDYEEDGGGDEGEYEDDYQFTRGDFEQNDCPIDADAQADHPSLTERIVDNRQQSCEPNSAQLSLTR
ncbi:hypothetical protein MPSEU_000932600 [Mayamaea pseudoterrestris]|nr:hypothetical protein MPSEU_000932600 [Mayamaea pseudoterrestris]